MCTVGYSAQQVGFFTGPGLNYIFQDLFRDTPLDNIWRTQICIQAKGLTGQTPSDSNEQKPQLLEPIHRSGDFVMPTHQVDQIPKENAPLKVYFTVEISNQSST